MYWINIFIAVDRLVNVMCHGHLNGTVSARVGFFAEYYRQEGGGRYWRALECIINFAFKPLDGPNHCRRAMLREKYQDYSDGNDVARAFLAWIVILFCGLTSIPFRLAVLIKPEWGYHDA